MPGEDGLFGPRPVEEYPGNLTPYALVSCVIAALGGLIFGYDIGITGGVTSMDSFLKEFFPSVYRRVTSQGSTADPYCKFNSQTLTMFTSSLYLSAIVSSLFASTVSRKFGRKPSILLGGFMFCGGSLMNGFARSVWMLIAGRILLGFGVGFANHSAPLYISEIAPYKYRGALNICFQLSITIGILVANVLNFGFAKIKGGWGWRLSLGGALGPLAITFASLLLPETPSFLIDQYRRDEALARLKRIRGVENVDREFDDLVRASELSRRVENPWRHMLRHRTNKYSPHLTMAIAIPFFQQLSGINAIVFYAPPLFRAMGLGSNASLMSAVITGGVNVLAAVVSIFGVDRWGRRFLFMEGGVQMFVSQVAVAICMAIEFGSGGGDRQEQLSTKPYAMVVVLFICLHVAGFAWSWGPLGWLVPSEIFPLEIRPAAQGLTVSVNMLCTFAMAQAFLAMLCHLKFGIFLLFAFFTAAMTAFVYLFLPETKNVPIDVMLAVWKDHWFWSRFI